MFFFRIQFQFEFFKELLRLIFEGKIKNHLRIFEDHFGRIVKNHKAQV